MKNDPTASAQDTSPSLLDPLALGGTVLEYVTDAWQRSVLYADVMRQRGDQYRAHLEEIAPHVLEFPSELVMSGRELPEPVNYALVRIVAPPELPADPAKRPFVVVDPRAGHGPGIGGFKPDSEIGAAQQAGHPCYFVGFLPDPVPGQTIEDVMRAEAAFLRKVIDLHPQSIGKPAVVGNCQAGWQVLMTAAVWPELFGPIILAGAPLSYWAGDNPMRYAGGLLGGSWMTALTSDVGAGFFDGAWLVSNFENLDPANTWWSKKYNLYSNVDTEAPRYLGFERYWGGHVFLDGGEMQYIVDNLFIGNKLATAELLTSDGIRIDLRNVRSPIVVFCSYGDNITPPAQALGWITDLYRDDADVLGHDQTIVYATHESIGHLGIFVSGSVGRKEHREFASNIELIDLLPAGIYEAVVEDRPAEATATDLIDGDYLMSIRRRGVEDVRAIVKPDLASERRFAAAARVSEINLALYRNFLQPWVRALSTPESARWLQVLNPLRVNYELWSSRNTLAPLVADAAERVRAGRTPVGTDNPLLRAQTGLSEAIEQGLDRYRDQRDRIYAVAFDALYGSPAMQALAGQGAADTAPPRAHPGDSPEHRALVAETLAGLHHDITRGGLVEAAIRAQFFVLGLRGEADERQYHHARQLLVQSDDAPQAGTVDFRALVRRQALMLRLEPDAAIAALPDLIAGSAPARIRAAADAIGQIARTGGPLSAEEQSRLAGVLEVFHQAAGKRGTRGSPTKAGAPAQRQLKRAATPAGSAKPAIAAKSANRTVVATGRTPAPAAQATAKKSAASKSATRAKPANPGKPGPRPGRARR